MLYGNCFTKMRSVLYLSVFIAYIGIVQCSTTKQKTSTSALYTQPVRQKVSVPFSTAVGGGSKEARQPLTDTRIASASTGWTDIDARDTLVALTQQIKQSSEDLRKGTIKQKTSTSSLYTPPVRQKGSVPVSAAVGSESKQARQPLPNTRMASPSTSRTDIDARYTLDTPTGQVKQSSEDVRKDTIKEKTSTSSFYTPPVEQKAPVTVSAAVDGRLKEVQQSLVGSRIASSSTGWTNIDARATLVAPTEQVKQSLKDVRKESSCGNGQSECINIYRCKPLLALLQKTERTSEDTEMLKKSQCGVQGDTPLVCCPSQCFTPERRPGYCINIYQCPTLSNLLTPPVSNKTMAIFESFRCDGPDKYSVCCSYYKNTEAVKPAVNCKLSAMPPDPRTGCCGIEFDGAFRTYEGSRTRIGMYPWLAGIQLQEKNKTRLICGGALISARYVLTAAHCIRISEQGKLTNVLLGDYDVTNNGPDCVVQEEELTCTDGSLTIPIKRVIPHPSFKTETKQNDIALLRLSKDAPFTDFIRPVCLPASDRTLDPPKNFLLFAAGWGAVSETKHSSNVMRHVGLPFKTHETCRRAYNTTQTRNYIARGHVCAGGVKGQDTCDGDDGTPLVYEHVKTWEVIGLKSFGGIPCGRQGVPGVYTNVFHYLPWIINQMKQDK